MLSGEPGRWGVPEAEGVGGKSWTDGIDGGSSWESDDGRGWNWSSIVFAEDRILAENAAR